MTYRWLRSKRIDQEEFWKENHSVFCEQGHVMMCVGWKPQVLWNEIQQTWACNVCRTRRSVIVDLPSDTQK